jgi:hypothetical protein
MRRGQRGPAIAGCAAIAGCGQNFAVMVSPK